MKATVTLYDVDGSPLSTDVHEIRPDGDITVDVRVSRHATVPGAFNVIVEVLPASWDDDYDVARRRAMLSPSPPPPTTAKETDDGV